MPSPTARVVQRLRRTYKQDVLWHEEWGSKHRKTYASRRVLKPAKMPCDTVFQHITVTLDTGPLTGDFKRDVQTVERIGAERFGSGVSYNWVVDMETGQIAVGQPLDAKGTHTVMNIPRPGFSRDQNYHARAIAVLGMPGTPLSKAAEGAITCILAAMVDEGVLLEGFDYKPHSWATAKDCPCEPTRSRMDEIRAAVWPLRKRAVDGWPKQKKPTRVTKARGLIVAAIQAAAEGRRKVRLKRSLKNLPNR